MKHKQPSLPRSVYIIFILTIVSNVFAAIWILERLS
jgi:hypothetical protein